jgi:hypothetical protein
MDYFAHMKPPVLPRYSIIIIVAVLMAAVAFISQKDELPGKHLELVLRSLGHQLLLSAKDSSSRVLPVRQLNEHTYQVSFQNDFGFVSDSLINIVQRTFEKEAPTRHYIVNLKTCDQKETVFAFEINGQAGDLAPCRGRKLAVGCYLIEIEFLKETSFNSYWWLLLLIPLGFVGFYVKGRFRQKEETALMPGTADYLPLGRFQFYAGHNLLTMENKRIALSEKETQALTIFAANRNQVVEREKLMKEIWEDNGLVVISRNVDVLVSKLRKKLIDDSSIKIINVPGRGYKFIIG